MSKYWIVFENHAPLPRTQGFNVRGYVRANNWKAARDKVRGKLGPDFLMGQVARVTKRDMLAKGYVEI